MINPYPGLRPFQYEESYLFFGREGQSEELLRKLQKSHFVAVVGTSGSGKSSLVRAGLMSLLSSGFMQETAGSWKVAVFRPGDNPTLHLAEALIRPAFAEQEPADDALKIGIAEKILRRSAVGLLDYFHGGDYAENENLLVVVDQFEEIFRYKKDARSDKTNEDAADFVKLLLEATKNKSSRIFVIMTMRSDFLGDCAEFHDLPEAINEGQYLIPRLTRDQLRQVIASPAKVYGAKVSQALVTHLLNDIGDDHDQLPVLQHALMRTWDAWAKEKDPSAEIKFEHFAATGGMESALSKHANEAFNELTAEQKLIAEKMFKTITEIDRDNRETRRATPLETISRIADSKIEEVIPVIDAFRQPGRTFLMPPYDVKLRPESLIDISHESLIRKWNKLAKWGEVETESAQKFRRLAEDAFLHKQGKMDFWSEPGLTNALAWREHFKPNESWAELYYKTWGKKSLSDYPETMDYLDESKRFRNKELADEEYRKNKEIVMLRRFVISMGIMIPLLIVAGGVVFYLYNDALNLTKREEFNRDGLTFLEQGDNTNAKVKFVALLNSLKDQTPTPKILIPKWWAYHNLGIVYSKEKQYNEAEKYFFAALELLGEKDTIDKLNNNDKAPDGDMCFAKPKKPNPLENNPELSELSIKASKNNDEKAKDIKRSKIATRLRLAQLYREWAANPTGDVRSLQAKSQVSKTNDVICAQLYNSRAIYSYNRLIKLQNESDETPAFMGDLYIDLADAHSFKSNDTSIKSENAKESYQEALKYLNLACNFYGLTSTCNMEGIKDKKNALKIVSILKKMAKFNVYISILSEDQTTQEAIGYLNQALEIQERKDGLNFSPVSLEVAEIYDEIAEASKAKKIQYVNLSNAIKDFNFKENKTIFEFADVENVVKAYLVVEKDNEGTNRYKKAGAVYDYAIELSRQNDDQGNKLRENGTYKEILKAAVEFYQKNLPDDVKINKYNTLLDETE